MTHANKISAFVAMGLIMAMSTVAAQKAPTTTSGGEITYRTLGQDFGVESSKFTEYREVPTGTSIPYLNLWSSGGKIDFSLTGYNIRQKDQQFLGQVKAAGLGLKFNWNEIPHAMGNSARTIYTQTATGEWSMSPTLRQALQNAVDVSTAARTLPNLQTLLAPTFADANQLDINGTRRTGNVELSLGKYLPADVTFTFRNELKSGFRGQAGLNENFRISPGLQVMNPLDEITNDFGVRASKNFARGNAYVTLNRNVYNNRAQTLMIDYPFQAFDAPVATVGGVSQGGPSRERAVMAPDNSANTATAGFQLKFDKQTRINFGLSLSERKQDAAFYGFTAYSLARTTSGLDASTAAAMPQQSLNGKTNATMYNVSFSSRPVEGLDLRASYRVYDLTDKTKRFVVPGDWLGTSWSNSSTTTDPYGFATANVYDTKSSRFTASAAYDFKSLVVEGQVRSANLERTAREAEKGTESGMGVTALYHYNDQIGFRGMYDVSKRTAKGETIYGFQMDEAPFTNTRTGIDVELSPFDGLDLSVGYIRRNVDYTDRPNRVVVASGAVVTSVAPFANTPSGLLDSKYDSYTGEINWTANDRLELGAYMTYEKSAQTDQWSTTQGNGTTTPYSINNLVNYAGSDKTNTYGANAVIQVIPNKGTLLFNAVNQKVDGLMDVTAREAGTFYTPGRAGLIPAGQGGAADVNDWDDTEITTLSAQFDWTLSKAWTMGVGYTYEKYDFKDAFVVPNNELLPVSTIIEMKPIDGAYKVNLVFAKLSFKF